MWRGGGRRGGEGEADGSTFSFTLPFLLLIYSTTVSFPPSPKCKTSAEGFRERCLLFNGKCFRKTEAGEEGNRDHLLWTDCALSNILCKHRTSSIKSEDISGTFNQVYDILEVLIMSHQVYYILEVSVISN